MQVTEKNIRKLLEEKTKEIRITIEEAKRYLDLGKAYNKIESFTKPYHQFAKHFLKLGYVVDRIENFESDENGPLSGTIVLISNNVVNADDDDDGIIDDFVNQSQYDFISYPKPLMPDSRQLDFIKHCIEGLTYDENNLVDLTSNNQALLKDYIVNGIPGISRRYNFNAKRIFDAIKVANGDTFPYHDLDSVKEFVKQVDIDNSTMDTKNHKSVAVNFFANFIISSENDFELRLKAKNVNVNKGLVDNMVDSFMQQPNGYGARSLASKICKFMYQFDTGDDDRYFINDSIVRSILPYYERKYGIANPSIVPADISYSALYDRLLTIQNIVNISKSKIDNIMWFCYKSWNKK